MISNKSYKCSIIIYYITINIIFIIKFKNNSKNITWNFFRSIRSLTKKTNKNFNENFIKSRFFYDLSIHSIIILMRIPVKIFFYFGLTVKKLNTKKFFIKFHLIFITKTKLTSYERSSFKKLWKPFTYCKSFRLIHDLNLELKFQQTFKLLLGYK